MHGQFATNNMAHHIILPVLMFQNFLGCGPTSKNWKAVDKVVIYCNQDGDNNKEYNSNNLMHSSSLCTLGYETPDKSFSSFTRAQMV